MSGLRARLTVARLCSRLIASPGDKEIASAVPFAIPGDAIYARFCTRNNHLGAIYQGNNGFSHHARSISTRSSLKQEKDGEKEPVEDAQAENPLHSMSTEDLHVHVQEIKKNLDEKEKSIEDLKDKLMRTLADMENLRERTSKQLEEARKFATQGLVKSLVEVADNLERAASSVLKDVDETEIDVEKAMGLLRSLQDGVVMTDGILMKILEKEGVQRYDPTGEKFDPNLHDALFEVPSEDKEPGTVAVVVKKGYLMHDRAVRAAEVGVVKDT